jgi:hypothetical protein
MTSRPRVVHLKGPVTQWRPEYHGGMTERARADVKVHAGVASGSATAYAPTISVKSNLWINWAQIAIVHAREAREHRDQSKAGSLKNILPEMHASMVAVTAVAFAIEALHDDVAPLVGRNPDARSGRGRQWAYVLATFCSATPAARNWQQEMEWLVSLRDTAVHFHGESHEPVWHAGLETNIARENVDFSVESSERAVNFLLAIFTAFFVPDQQCDPAVTAWGTAHAHVLGELEALRS